MKTCINCGNDFTGKGETCSPKCRRAIANFAPKICSFPECNLEFMPNSPTARFCGPKHEVKCKECGTLFTVRTKAPKTLCSSCAKIAGNAKRSATNLERYGFSTPLQNEEVQKKVKATVEARYGVGNPSQSSEVKERIRATNLERYGFSSPLQNDEIKAKAVATIQDKYGVDHVSRSKEVADKKKANNLKKYGVEHSVQRPDVQAKIKATLVEKYGVDNAFAAKEVKEKIAKTMVERYGVESPLQNAAIREKVRATNLERYGAEELSNSPEIVEKRKKTNLERRGVEVTFQDEEVKDLARKTNLERYGHEIPTKTRAVKDKIKATNSERYGHNSPLGNKLVQAKAKATNMAHRGVEWPSQSEEVREKIALSIEESLRSNHSRDSISKVNKRWAASIESKFGVEVHFEKAVKGRRFDLFIPEKNLLVDINPTVTHNSAVSFACVVNKCESCDHTPLAREYHFSRAKLAQAEGYSLIQVYDWNTEDQIINFLSGKLGADFQKFSARKLEVRRIPQKTANAFFASYHIQKGAKKQTYCYGLFLGEELVAAASFSEARFKAKAEFEWVRFAVKRGVIVHGGPARLFQQFVKDANPTSVISYIDFNHTTALNVFLAQSGFVESNFTGPSLVWSKKKDRIYNNSLLALGADRLLKTAYGTPEECGMKNDEIMLLEGWLPVYTAGNRVFKWGA